MKSSTFILLFGAVLGAYFFGDFDTFYGIVPEGGSRLNALFKGILSGAAVLIFLNKARDMIKVNAAVAVLLVGGMGVVGYTFEAGKEQRLGRKVLASHLNEEVAQGATIHLHEGAKGGDSAVLIEFAQSDMKPEKFPTLRPLPVCNIKIPGAEQILERLSESEIQAARFFWQLKTDRAGYAYDLLAVMPHDHNWYLRSARTEGGPAPTVESVEKARRLHEDGSYVDTHCAKPPFKLHKKEYSAQNVMRAEWDERESSDRANERTYDRAGKLLDGLVESEFMYIVQKSEAFQKGFGKAGLLKCTGYYTYKQGIKHGPYEFYYPGRIAKALSGRYENGEAVGLHKQYFPNGSLKTSWGQKEIDTESTQPLVR